MNLRNPDPASVAPPLTLSLPLWLFHFFLSHEPSCAAALLPSLLLPLSRIGIAFWDSWTSPEDFVFSWGPLLKDVSRLDNNGLQKENNMLHTLSTIPRELNFIEHASDIGWKEYQRAKPIIIDPAMYRPAKV